MILNEESFDFWLLAGQKKQFEQISVSSGKLWWEFIIIIYLFIFLQFFDITIKECPF